MTKIVFMGTPEFSVSVLTMLFDEGHTIAAVVTSRTDQLDGNEF